jgi:hypothetical protein
LASARTAEGASSTTIAEAARAAGRPIAASITLDRVDRIRLNGCWRVIGLAMIDDDKSGNCLSSNSQTGGESFPVDSAKVSAWLASVSPTMIGVVKPGIDPVSEYFARALECPREMLRISLESKRGVSLDSTCKL